MPSPSSKAWRYFGWYMNWMNFQASAWCWPEADMPTKINGKPQQTVSVTDSLGMSAAGQNQAEAWQFVQFMYQPNTARSSTRPRACSPS